MTPLRAAAVAYLAAMDATHRRIQAERALRAAVAERSEGDG